MRESDIKNAIDKLVPDSGMKSRLSQKMMHSKRSRPSFKALVAVAASLAIVICAGIFAVSYLENKTGINHVGEVKGNIVQIPKAELPESPESVKMRGLIVYQGRIYFQSAVQIDTKTAEGLLDEKIGKTKGNITEWSKQDDYAVELASTIGIQDVYTVKGYDKSFRLIAGEKIDGVLYAQLYECLNGITVKTGADIFGKFKIQGNVASVKYELFDSWNNGKQEYKPLTQLKDLNDFLTALNSSIPYEQDKLAGFLEDQSADSQKFVYIALQDGTNVQLRIFKGGYVYFNNVNIFFKLDDTVFNKFWNELA